jgi:predicted transcriptional regulator
MTPTIAALAAQGMSQRAIAEQLGVTRARVRAELAPSEADDIDERLTELETAIAQLADLALKTHGVHMWRGRASLRAVFDRYLHRHGQAVG